MVTRESTAHPERRDGVPGEQAEKPTEIPAQGWLQVAKRGWSEAKTDQVPLLGAGVAFFGFLAIFPALIALVTLYGLFADPATIADQVNSLNALLAEVRQLIVDQINNQSRAALGWSAILAIAVALFSASGGVNNLMTAINVAYDEDDQRNPVKKRLIALGLTLAAIVFIAVMLGLVAVVPALLQGIFGDSPIIRFMLSVARWVLVAVLVTAALALLYRIAPDRDAPKMRWVSVGAALATVLWLVASIGFSIYVSTVALMIILCAGWYRVRARRPLRSRARSGVRPLHMIIDLPPAARRPVHGLRSAAPGWPAAGWSSPTRSGWSSA